MKEYPEFHAAASRVNTTFGGKLFPNEVIDAYQEPYRYWHNLYHMQQVFTDVVQNISTFSDRNRALVLAAIYHDVVYNPQSSTNEEDSIKFMRSTLEKYPNDWANSDVIDTAAIFIQQTKIVGNKQLGINFADQKIFNSNSLLDVIEYGQKIWKEYSFVSREEFVDKHISLVGPYFTHNPIAKEYIRYVRNYRPSLALYAGSFNPYHIGHKAIADKAQKTFEKVLLAQGLNPDKTCISGGFVVVPNKPKGRYECITFGGMLSDLYKHLSKTYDVTVVKGIRDSKDLDYEKIQERYLKDICPDMKFLYITSNAEHEHISSSALRNLEKYGQDISHYLT